MSVRPRKARRQRLTGHRAGIAMQATGGAGATIRSFKRYLHLQQRGADRRGSHVHGTNRQWLATFHGQRPEQKPKEKK